MNQILLLHLMNPLPLPIVVICMHHVRVVDLLNNNLSLHLLKLVHILSDYHIGVVYINNDGGSWLRSLAKKYFYGNKLMFYHLKARRCVS